jgi:hypothetical protein
MDAPIVGLEHFHPDEPTVQVKLETYFLLADDEAQPEPIAVPSVARIFWSRSTLNIIIGMVR